MAGGFIAALSAIARRFGHIKQISEATQKGVEVKRTATVHGRTPFELELPVSMGVVRGLCGGGEAGETVSPVPCYRLPSPARGRGVGGEGQRSKLRLVGKQNCLPSPPPLSRKAGEGSKTSGKKP